MSDGGMSSEQYNIYKKQKGSDSLWDQMKKDFSSKVDDVKRILTTPIQSSEPSFDEYLIIENLGYETFSTQNNLEEEWKKNKLIATVLSIASLTSEFSIRIDCKEGLYSYAIGLKHGYDTSVKQQLSINYGYVKAKTERLNTPDSEFCSFTRIGNKNENDSEEELKTDIVNYVSSITNLTDNKNFVVEFVFSKINKDRISTRLADLISDFEDLIEYQKITVQTNMQSNDNHTGGGINWIVYNKESGSKGESYSYGVNSELVNVEVKILLPYVEEEINILKSAEKSQGWNVSASVDCDCQNTSKTLKSIINALAITNGYSAEWEDYSPQFASPILVENLHEFAKLPECDFVGFEYIQNEDYYLQPTKDGDVELGNLLKNRQILDQKIHISYKSINRHSFICGMTGSGKTNTVFHLLSKLDKPFLVIEPVKSEYRNIVLDDKNVTVHTMGSTDKNALIFNPFWFPRNASLQYHIDGLKMIISSAFSLYAAMPNILEQCLYNVYAKCGWNFATGKNAYEGELPESYLYPTFDELDKEVAFYLDSSAFEGENLSTYKGALSARLKSFTTGVKGLLLNTTKHPDYEQWAKSNQIIELDDLSDDADKAIVMGSILIQYYQYLKTLGNKDEELKHVTVIEEAHRLFKNVPTTSNNPEVANSSGQLVETLTNMMAEIRAYGEGIVVVDQSPSKVATDVIKNSNVKIIHRLDSKDDIDTIEQSLLLKESGIAISSLELGQALVRLEGMKKPAKILFSKSKSGSVKYEATSIARDDDWKKSSVVDILMQNNDFCDDLYDLSDKFVNSLLFDAIAMPSQNNIQINVIIRETMQQVHDMIMSFGFLDPTDLENNAYNDLLIRGTNLVLATNQLYRNNYKFCILFRMMIERELQLYFTKDIYAEEAMLFEKYRSNMLYNKLEMLQKNNREYRKRFSDISIILGRHTLYAPIICELLDRLEKLEYLQTMDKMEWQIIDKFVKENIEDCFAVYPVEIISSSISQKMYRIIQKYIEFAKC